jgi:hypothetical protein
MPAAMGPSFCPGKPEQFMKKWLPLRLRKMFPNFKND